MKDLKILTFQGIYRNILFCKKKWHIRHPINLILAAIMLNKLEQSSKNNHLNQSLNRTSVDLPSSNYKQDKIYENVL